MSDRMESLSANLESILRRAHEARGSAVPEQQQAPVCPTCQGAGYLRYDVSVDDPRFGQLVICECMRAELDQKRQRSLLEKSQLAMLQHLTFATWVVKFPRDAPRLSPDAAHAIARKYVETLSFGDLPWLFLYGERGTGKTHLAAAIGNARIARGQPAIFMVVSDLLDHLRAAYRPDSSVTYDDLFESLRNTQLLILDDLGMQTATPWAREKLFQLINHRYNRRLPTVITMNMEAEEIDPRLWSRINDVALTARCEVKAPDKRTGLQQPAPSPRPTRSKLREDTRI